MTKKLKNIGSNKKIEKDKSEVTSKKTKTILIFFTISPHFLENE